MTDRRIRLNVGGQRFETFLSTLSGSHYFEARLSNRWNATKIGDEEPLFVDRDPAGFAHVLNYLRDHNYPFPRHRYRHELDFYGVDFEGSFDEAQGSESSDNRGAFVGFALSSRTRQIEQQLEQTSSSTHPPQLLDRAIGVPLRLFPSTFPHPVASDQFVFLPSSTVRNSALVSIRIPPRADICSDLLLRIKFLPGVGVLPPSSASELMVSGILERMISEIRLVLDGVVVDSIDGSSLVRYHLLGDATLPPLANGHGSELRQRIHREKETGRFALRLPMFQTYLKDDGVLRPFWFFPGFFKDARLEFQVGDLIDYELEHASLQCKAMYVPVEERDCAFQVGLAQNDGLVALGWKHRKQTFAKPHPVRLSLDLDGFNRAHQLVFSVTDVPVPCRNVTHHRIRSCELWFNHTVILRLTEEELVEQMAYNLLYPEKAVYCLCLLSGHCSLENVMSVQLVVELQQPVTESVIFAVDSREEVSLCSRRF